MAMVHRGYVQVFPPDAITHMQVNMDVLRRRNNVKNDFVYPAMIPDPDYSDTEDDNNQEHSSKMPGRQKKDKEPNSGVVKYNEEGLIVPKKPQNPCKESAERQSLHRELLFNQKIGKNVLGQKSELQKAMEKIKDEQKKKELEEEKFSKRTVLEKKLEEQANKIKKQEGGAEVKTDSAKSEESEFLRVHARVRAHTLPVDSKT